MRGLKAIAALFLLTTGAAQAEVTGTVTLVSDYVFRGITQSAEDPALQGSVDWSHESGLYAGAWASCCLDFGPGSDTEDEVDLYAGFAGEVEGGFGYDVGLVYYYYLPDDDDIEYFEIYLGGSYGPFDAKFWYSDDYVNSGDSSQYIEGNLNYGLPQDLTLIAHVGYSFGDAFEDAEYVDYAIGLGYTVGHFDLELKYIDTDIDNGDPLFSGDDVLNSEGRVWFSVSTTFPWSSESE